MAWEDGRTRYVGTGMVTFADGRQVAVVAALGGVFK